MKVHLDQRVDERSQRWDPDVVRKVSESERAIRILNVTVHVELGLPMEQNYSGDSSRFTLKLETYRVCECKWFAPGGVWTMQMGRWGKIPKPLSLWILASSGTIASAHD
jgi:hypothetical protein